MTILAAKMTAIQAIVQVTWAVIIQVTRLAAIQVVQVAIQPVIPVAVTLAAIPATLRATQGSQYPLGLSRKVRRYRNLKLPICNPKSKDGQRSVVNQLRLRKRHRVRYCVPLTPFAGFRLGFRG